MADLSAWNILDETHCRSNITYMGARITIWASVDLIEVRELLLSGWGLGELIEREGAPF